MSSLTLKQVLWNEPDMRREGVSKVARSPRGFLSAYKKYKTLRNMPESWKLKRRNFIARHIIQYKKNPTYRRRLALIAWAFDPES